MGALPLTPAPALHPSSCGPGFHRNQPHQFEKPSVPPLPTPPFLPLSCASSYTLPHLSVARQLLTCAETRPLPNVYSATVWRSSEISGLRDRHAACLHRASMAQARGSGMGAQDETVSLASPLKHHKLEQLLRSKPFREPKWEKQHLCKGSELFPLIVPFFIGFRIGFFFFFAKKPC